MRFAVFLVAVLAFMGRQTAFGQLPEYAGFIRVQNNRFVDANCQDFPVNGFNTWMLMEAAAGLLYSDCQTMGMDPVQYTFSTASNNGMTVLRVFGHGVNNTLPLQTSPGVYNETAFTALDYILDTAAYHGVKVIFTMGDNWQYADSKRNYNMWAGYDEDSDQFWTNDKLKSMYQAHMEVMTNRINTFNGIKYKDDDTIFAWNLMNEPRCNCFPTSLPYPADFNSLPSGCNPSCTDSITEWISEMSTYLKSIDPNHMVTIGQEGFWGYYDQNMQYNPENSVSPWAALTGNNFTEQHAFDSIDFTGVHYWPDQWTPKATSDWAFFLQWIERHGNISAQMGKPLVLEELGTAVVANQSLSLLHDDIINDRTPFMQMVYGQFNQSLESEGIWRGTLFWQWGLCPANSEDNPLEVAAGDSDFQSVISPASMAAVQKSIEISPISQCQVVEVKNATIYEIPSGEAQILPQRVPTTTVYNTSAASTAYTVTTSTPTVQYNTPVSISSGQSSGSSSQYPGERPISAGQTSILQQIQTAG